MIAAEQSVDEAYQRPGRKTPDYLLEGTVEYVRIVLLFLFGHGFMLHENRRYALPAG
jgi:hypothetical protein